MSLDCACVSPYIKGERNLFSLYLRLQVDFKFQILKEKEGKQATFDQRVEMCRLAFETYPNVVVTECERTMYERCAKNVNEGMQSSFRFGTIDLMECLKVEEPETDFTLVLGSDTFLDLTNWTWRRAKDLVYMIQGRILVFRRIFNDKDISSDNLHLEERVHTTNQMMPLDSRNIQIILASTLSSTSSSQARSSTDENALLQWLSPQILKYIKGKKLYAFGENN